MQGRAKKPAASKSKKPTSSFSTGPSMTRDINKKEERVVYEEHEVPVIFKGLTCVCNNCGGSFSNYKEYTAHQVPAHLLPVNPPGHRSLDLELRLAQPESKINDPLPHPQAQGELDLNLKLGLHPQGQVELDLNLKLGPPSF